LNAAILNRQDHLLADSNYPQFGGICSLVIRLMAPHDLSLTEKYV
jgi:hypothetical protein